MHQSLSSILFPGYRRQVLGLLLLRPEEALHGREIARRTGLPAGTITRELNMLAEVGLLKREKRGNQRVFSAETSSSIFPELASILRKTSGMVEPLALALAPLAPGLRVAFVFGSMAQGRETAGSDIDVMLIGKAGFARVAELLFPVQATLGREINAQVLSIAEFRSKARTEPFLVDVLSKPKLFLIGSQHDLDELAVVQS